MGAGHQKDQTLVGSLGSSASLPNSLEKGEGLKKDLMISEAYLRKLHRNPRVQDSESLQVEHLELLGEWVLALFHKWALALHISGIRMSIRTL